MDKLKHAVSSNLRMVSETRVGSQVVATAKATWGKRIGKVAIIGALAIAGYFAYGAFTPEEALQTVIVKADGGESVVAVQGTVVAAQDVSLGFDGSGKVSWVGVKVGDHVRAGQSLASLSQNDLSAQISSLIAQRDAAVAKLDELKRGTRPEDIAVAESQVASAQSQADLAAVTLADTLNDAFPKFDEAVRTKTDTFFSNPRSSAPRFNITTDTQIRIPLENERLALEALLVDQQNKQYTEPTVADAAAVKATAMRIRSYLDTMATAINSAQAYNAVSSTELESYKAAISSARATISAYITSVSTAQTQYANLSLALKTAQSQLALKKQGASAEEIRAQEAQVRAAQANISATQATAAKRTITAPFAGLITKVDPKVGSIVSGTSGGTISLISSNHLQIEAYVPEVYIAKIALTDNADVSLDAYGSNDVLKAAVSSIDPSSTVRDGITTYKVVLTLSEPDDRIRAGMGGDILIHTTNETPIITIPKAALVDRNGKHYVQIPAGNGNRVIEREVTVSKINEADVAEISEGLSDGDTIVLKPIQ